MLSLLLLSFTAFSEPPKDPPPSHQPPPWETDKTIRFVEVDLPPDVEGLYDEINSIMLSSGWLNRYEAPSKAKYLKDLNHIADLAETISTSDKLCRKIVKELKADEFRQFSQESLVPDHTKKLSITHKDVSPYLQRMQSAWKKMLACLEENKVPLDSDRKQAIIQLIQSLNPESNPQQP